MSEPKRYWISDHGMAESECGAWVHYDDWLKLEEARFALEFRLELATKRNAELHALHETVVRELENVRTVKDSMIRIAKDLGEQCETLRALLDEARERIARLEEAAHDVLRYFTSGNDAPVERATIRNDSPAIHRLRAALGEVKR